MRFCTALSASQLALGSLSEGASKLVNTMNSGWLVINWKKFILIHVSNLISGDTARKWRFVGSCVYTEKCEEKRNHLSWLSPSQFAKAVLSSPNLNLNTAATQQAMVINCVNGFSIPSNCWLADCAAFFLCTVQNSAVTNYQSTAGNWNSIWYGVVFG